MAYVPETLVLRTRRDGDAGVTAHEFLAAIQSEDSAEIRPVGRILRLLTCTRSQAVVRLG